MTLRITLHIFRKTFALYIDAVTSYSGSLQIPTYFQTLSLRLTEEIVNLRAHHVPR